MSLEKGGPNASGKALGFMKKKKNSVGLIYKS